MLPSTFSKNIDINRPARGKIALIVLALSHPLILNLIEKPFNRADPGQAALELPDQGLLCCLSFHILCMRSVKALARLRKCTGSSDLSRLAYCDNHQKRNLLHNILDKQ